MRCGIPQRAHRTAALLAAALALTTDAAVPADAGGAAAAAASPTPPVAAESPTPPVSAWYTRAPHDGCDSLARNGVPLHLFPMHSTLPRILAVGEYFCSHKSPYGDEDPATICSIPPVPTVRISNDGGDSWACMDSTVPSSILRYGAATFGGNFTGPSGVSTWLLCVVGGGVLQTLGAAGTRSVTCSRDGLTWYEAAPLPVPVIRHRITQLWRDLVLLVGGERTDGSTDQWLGTVDAAAGTITGWERWGLVQDFGGRVRPLVFTVGDLAIPGTARVFVGGGIQVSTNSTAIPAVALADLWVAYPDNNTGTFTPLIRSKYPLPVDSVRGSGTTMMLTWGGPAVAGTTWEQDCYKADNPHFKCLVLLTSNRLYYSTDQEADVAWRSVDQLEVKPLALPTFSPFRSPEGILLSTLTRHRDSDSGNDVVFGFSSSTAQYHTLSPVPCQANCSGGSFSAGCGSGPRDFTCRPCTSCVLGTSFLGSSCYMGLAPTGAFGADTVCKTCDNCYTTWGVGIIAENCTLTNNTVCTYDGRGGNDIDDPDQGGSDPSPKPSRGPVPLNTGAIVTGILLPMVAAALAIVNYSLLADKATGGGGSSSKAGGPVGQQEWSNGMRHKGRGAGGWWCTRSRLRACLAGRGGAIWHMPLLCTVATWATAAGLSAALATPGLYEYSTPRRLSPLAQDLFQLACFLWTAMLASCAGSLFVWMYLHASPEAQRLRATLTTGAWRAAPRTAVVLLISLLHGRAAWHVAGLLATAGPGAAAGWYELTAAMPGVALAAQLVSLTFEAACFTVSLYVASSHILDKDTSGSLTASSAAQLAGLAGFVAFVQAVVLVLTVTTATLSAAAMITHGATGGGGAGKAGGVVRSSAPSASSGGADGEGMEGHGQPLPSSGTGGTAPGGASGTRPGLSKLGLLSSPQHAGREGEEAMTMVGSQLPHPHPHAHPRPLRVPGRLQGSGSAVISSNPLAALPAGLRVSSAAQAQQQREGHGGNEGQVQGQAQNVSSNSPPGLAATDRWSAEMAAGTHAHARSPIGNTGPAEGASGDAAATAGVGHVASVGSPGGQAFLLAGGGGGAGATGASGGLGLAGGPGSGPGPGPGPGPLSPMTLPVPVQFGADAGGGVGGRLSSGVGGSVNAPLHGGPGGHGQPVSFVGGQQQQQQHGLSLGMGVGVGMGGLSHAQHGQLGLPVGVGLSVGMALAGMAHPMGMGPMGMGMGGMELVGHGQASGFTGVEEDEAEVEGEGERDGAETSAASRRAAQALTEAEGHSHSSPRSNDSSPSVDGDADEDERDAAASVRCSTVTVSDGVGPAAAAGRGGTASIGSSLAEHQMRARRQTGTASAGQAGRAGQRGGGAVMEWASGQDPRPFVQRLLASSLMGTGGAGVTGGSGGPDGADNGGAPEGAPLHTHDPSRIVALHLALEVLQNRMEREASDGSSVAGDVVEEP